MLRFAARSLRYAARRVIGHRYSSENYDPIVMKLGMDTHWDPGSVKGVNNGLRFAAQSLCYAARRVISHSASSAHSFDLIVMKLGMNTPWDPGSVMR